MTVGAITIFAVGRNFEYFRKIVSDLFFLHIECAEAFDARSVDNITVSFYGKHLGESGGMHSLIVISGDFAGFCFNSRQYSIDKSRFPYSRMSGEKSNLTFERLFDFV
jgi:hypothetical protein